MRNKGLLERNERCSKEMNDYSKEIDNDSEEMNDYIKEIDNDSEEMNAAAKK